MRLKLFAAVSSVAVLTWLGCSDPDPTPTPDPNGVVSGLLTFGAASGNGLYQPGVNLGPKLFAELPLMLAAARGAPRPIVESTRSDGGPPFVASEAIIRVAQPGLFPDEVMAQVQLSGLTLSYGVNVMPNWHLVKATRDGAPLSMEETLTLVMALRAHPRVQKAELNGIKHTLAIPNDNLYKYQWHYGQLQLPAAWDITKGSDSVIVAVIDTGILDHPDLAGKTVAGFDFISVAERAGDGDGRDGNPRDEGKDHPNDQSSWHGTHVAGTIGAKTNNGIGVAGVDWNCRIQPVRVLGRGGGTDADIAAGMAWAVGEPVNGVPANATPARVLNMSLGGDGDPSPVYQEAIDLGNKRGAVVVVAAGNENENTAKKTPANQSGVITVGSVGFTGKRSSFSNFGAEVDVIAPGGEMAEDADADGYPDGVLSTYADQSRGMKYDYLQGTSMATPHVAGIVALMKSVNGNLTSAEAERILKETAIGAYKCDQGCGSGLVNSYAAVLKAKGTVPTGPAELNVTSKDVPLGGSTRGVIGVANKGGGSLTVTAAASGENAGRVKFPAGATKTLGPAQADAIQVEVDVGGLANGDYKAGVELRAGAAGTVSVTLQFKVGVALAGKKTVVAAVYQDSAGAWQSDVAITVASAQQATYELAGLPPRDYYVIAGVDDNGNGKFFEDGERFGLYPSADNPEKVTIKAGARVTGADFTLIAKGSAPREDTKPIPVGGPCASKADCGNGGLCDESFAGGYCYKNCPGGDSECPAGSACFGTGQSAACLLTCPNAGVGRDTCRADYVCVSTSRASLAVCLQACKSNADCDAGQSCDGKGYCK